MLFCTTIAKIDPKNNNQWAGFNMLSQMMLLGDIEREIAQYNGKFKPVEKGELGIVETDWAGFKVLIQYRRIT